MIVAIIFHLSMYLPLERMKSLYIAKIIKRTWKNFFKLDYEISHLWSKSKNARGMFLLEENGRGGEELSYNNSFSFAAKNYLYSYKIYSFPQEIIFFFPLPNNYEEILTVYSYTYVCMRVYITENRGHSGLIFII